jgi:hypothetical protein
MYMKFESCILNEIYFNTLFDWNKDNTTSQILELLTKKARKQNTLIFKTFFNILKLFCLAQSISHFEPICYKECNFAMFTSNFITRNH